MHDPPGRDAIIVKQALRPETFNLEAATEIICSRTPSQIQIFKQHYHAKFGVYLEHDIDSRVSGDLKRVSCHSIFVLFSSAFKALTLTILFSCWYWLQFFLSINKSFINKKCSLL